ncbi:hypothetical protein [Ruminococcus flavefaciens]|uniref:hypothetical protein n=1 Tax=Ruminococcus flavefaciens TaxID=1265 RepID=UPI001A9A4951|nr:hypothetical protein [Ruminococcus flavefaciens]
MHSVPAGHYFVAFSVVFRVYELGFCDIALSAPVTIQQMFVLEFGMDFFFM